MIKKLSALTLFLFTILGLCAAELIEEISKPFEMRVYRLENGLTAYLSRNTREPRIKVMTAVRAGSLQDPETSSGLAHYFEHMMFKGNSKIGALEPEKEKILLDKIEQLFEDYRAEKDTAKRAAIYKEIDALSFEASKYSNDEYWELVNSMGGTGLNAWTSNDETVYVCDIPANQLKRFLSLEAGRFSEIRLRRFHTELETVYEEYNRSQNSDFKQAYSTFTESMYGKHPYGRPVLGLPEHLKSPSMRDIRKFFDKFYRPDTMAVVLSGDIDYADALKNIEETFGKLKNKNTEPYAPPALPLPNTKAEKTVRGPESEFLITGWSFTPTPENELMLDMLAKVLKNGKSGLFDRNLILPQKVQSLDIWLLYNRQSYLFIICAEPKKGQTLEALRDLVNQQLIKAAEGDFDTSMLEAIVNNERMQLVKSMENRNSTANYAVNSFVRQNSLKDSLGEYDAMEKVTKKQIQDFASEMLNSPAVTVFKQTGEAKRDSAVKPPITPVMIPKEQSAFAKEFAKTKPEREIEPHFPDFSKEIAENSVTDSLKLHSTLNKENDRFTLTYYFPGGSLFNRELALAFDYMKLLGTDDFTPIALREELYKYALTFSCGASRRYSYVAISGLQKNFTKAAKLLEHIINSVKPSAEAWAEYVGRTEKDRENQMKDQKSVLSNAVQYILYGKDNMSTAIVPMEAMRKMKAETLTNLIRNLKNTTHDIVYYGPESGENIAEILSKTVAKPQNMRPLAERTDYYKIQNPECNTVYLLDFPLQQMLVTVIAPDAEFDVKPYLFERLFSNYGPRVSMNELREKRALAYSAYVYYTNPGIFPRNSSLAIGEIGTQKDKLEAAVSGLLEILDSTPQDKLLFEASKDKAAKAIASSRYQNENLYFARENLKRLGLAEPIEKTVSHELENITFEDFMKQCANHLSAKKHSILIMGEIGKIDTDKLKKYGDVKVITLDDVFPLK